MASNWQIEARGVLYWAITTRTVDFEGTTYTVDFVELEPDLFANQKVRDVDDHTAEFTVEDPNGLV